jgi:hypothetical protein
MPYDEPDLSDPQMLVGVSVPGSEAATRRMAETFADEFARLGLERARILALYRTPTYAAAHEAWRQLGASEIERIVDESLAVWGRFRVVVRESAHDRERVDAEAETKLVRPGGFLRVIS